jgi:alginate O-acetyltransferase complex protein AlgI
MLFSSYEFIFAFLPTALLVYFWLGRVAGGTAAKIWLAGCSLFFYSWWNANYLPLLLTSITCNYAIGRKLAFGQSDNPKQKFLLGIGVVLNLAPLAYFKYSAFVITNVNQMLSTSIGEFHPLLPLAISFFTFQQITFLVDACRRGSVEYRFVDYVVFVSFFPQLIAGPIVHHREMMPQFEARDTGPRYENLSIGLTTFAGGLFKKLVIADSLANIATNGFDHSTSLGLVEAWVTSLSYTCQLYFDFSGYCDMAIGAALMFNIRLPLNFNSPYKASDIREFWRAGTLHWDDSCETTSICPWEGAGGTLPGSASTFSSSSQLVVSGMVQGGSLCSGERCMASHVSCNAFGSPSG